MSFLNMMFFYIIVNLLKLIKRVSVFANPPTHPPHWQQRLVCVKIVLVGCTLKLRLRWLQPHARIPTKREHTTPKPQITKPLKKV